MLIERYDLEIFTPPCDPNASIYTARASLSCDISDVLPYLNAILAGANYFPSAPALTWRKDKHAIAFHPDRIFIGNVIDRAEAEQTLHAVIDLVNRTWDRRAEITPDVTTRQRPTPMAIYKLLPNTNCKKCGEPTCYTFTLKLAASQKKVSDCPLLAEPQYAEKRAALEAIMMDFPAFG